MFSNGPSVAFSLLIVTFVDINHNISSETSVMLSAPAQVTTSGGSFHQSNNPRGTEEAITRMTGDENDSTQT